MDSGDLQLVSQNIYIGYNYNPELKLSCGLWSSFYSGHGLARMMAIYYFKSK